MERTESKIIQIAPSLEQQMIDVMSKFGWSLHGRQEIQIESGKGGRRRMTGELSRDLFIPDGYKLVLESERSLRHYVKLHFIRPINFKNSDKLNVLENEYFSLEFLKRPRLKAPILLGCFSSLFLLTVVKSTAKEVAGFLLILSIGGCGYWLYYIGKKRKQIDAKNKEIEIKGEEILRKAELLVEG